LKPALRFVGFFSRDAYLCDELPEESSSCPTIFCVAASLPSRSQNLITAVANLWVLAWSSIALGFMTAGRCIRRAIEITPVSGACLATERRSSQFQQPQPNPQSPIINPFNRQSPIANRQLL
jgi:hypothetical protein